MSKASSYPRVIVLAMAAGAAATAFAQSGAPLPPEKLATALPSAAWGDTTRGKVDLASEGTPIKRSEAKVDFTGKRGSAPSFRAIFRISDEGTYGASMYGYGAKYMTENVKSDNERTVVLPGGQRALLTSYTKDSMGLESFVGKRFVVRTNCEHATEAQCIDAFAKWDFKAAEALKP